MKKLPFKESIQSVWYENFNAPTPIQQKIWKPILNKESLIGIAPTGSGKTLGYLLPIFEKIKNNDRLQAIVIVPSQELAKQVGDVANEWGKQLRIKTQTLLGGANRQRQIQQLIEKPELIVSTPGRFMELLETTRKLKIHEVETIIFDEADYLVEEGPKDVIQELAHRLMRSTQFVFISATYSDKLSQTAKEVKANITEYIIEDHLNANDSVRHFFLVTPNREKVTVLRQLSYALTESALIFFQHIDQIDRTGGMLLHHHIPVMPLHGEVGNFERATAMRLFRKGQVKYLLTTDVASRGLDIPNVPMVIHFDKPYDLRTYIHRSGRTGRMGKPGIVLSLVNAQELRELEQMIGKEYMLEEVHLAYGELRKGRKKQSKQSRKKSKSKTKRQRRK